MWINSISYNNQSKMAFKPYNQDNTLPFIYIPQETLGCVPLYYPYIWNQYYNPQIQIPVCPSWTDKDQDTLTEAEVCEIKTTQDSIKNMVKKEEIFEIIIGHRQQFQSIKAIQDKTKDLMRPFTRMLYSYFKKLSYNSLINNKSQKQQINFFNAQVEELRSKNPCKFTDLIINFLKTASCELREVIEQYVNGSQFSHIISSSESFKHWKNKEELVCFLRQFVTDNKGFLKPTKFYRSQFKRVF